MNAPLLAPIDHGALKQKTGQVRVDFQVCNVKHFVHGRHTRRIDFARVDHTAPIDESRLKLARAIFIRHHANVRVLVDVCRGLLARACRVVLNHRLQRLPCASGKQASTWGRGQVHTKQDTDCY